MAKYPFKQYPVFMDGEIDVIVQRTYQAKSKLSRFFNKHLSDVPRYSFKISLANQTEKIGYIGLKFAFTEPYRKYYGQISYGIQEAFQGHKYAAKACKLIVPVLIDYHLDVVWIVVAPDNIASRKTCEAIGCELVEMIDLPPSDFLYKQGIHQACRYRWIVYPLRDI